MLLQEIDRLKQPWLCLAIPLAVAIVSCSVLFMVGATGWPGEVGVSATDFCERFRPGAIKQPANSLSNAGFVLAGIWIGWRAMRDRSAQLASKTAAPNWMSESTIPAALYASLGVLLGPGSAAMHASTTRWGETIDMLSMLIWASFTVTYAWARLRGHSQRTFLMSYFCLATVLGLLLVFGIIPKPIASIFGAMVIGFGTLEICIMRLRPGRSLDARWLAAAGFFFGMAFVIWIPSRTNGALCDPDSLLQGHAAWHLLSAAAVVSIFQYYRSERPKDKTPAPV